MEPITVGDTLDFLDTVAGRTYPASDGWTLTYRLVPRSSGDDVIEFDATAEGADYRVTVSAASTAAWAAGEYGWTSYVELAGVRHSIRSGAVTVRPDPALAEPGYDNRSAARLGLAAIEAVLLGRATGGQQEYTIGNRQLRFIPIPDLIVLRDDYRRAVRSEEAAERARLGLPDRNTSYVRFGRG